MARPVKVPASTAQDFGLTIKHLLSMGKQIKKPASAVPEFQKTLQHLLEWEREAELSSARQRLKQSPEVLQRAGHAMFRLRCSSQKTFFADEVLRFSVDSKSEGSKTEDLPRSGFMSGDVVVISRGDPLSAAAGEGIVLSKTTKSISVVVRAMPTQLRRSLVEGHSNGWRLDKACNELAFTRMSDALHALCAPQREQSGPAWLLPLLLSHSLISQGVLDSIPERPPTLSAGIKANRAVEPREDDADAEAAALRALENLEETKWERPTKAVSDSPMLLDRLHASRDSSTIQRQLERRVYQYRRPALPQGAEPMLHSVSPAAPHPGLTVDEMERDATANLKTGLAVSRLQREWIDSYVANNGGRAKGKKIVTTEQTKSEPNLLRRLQSAADSEFYTSLTPPSRVPVASQTIAQQGLVAPRGGHSASGSAVLTLSDIDGVLPHLTSLNASQRSAVVVGLTSQVSLIQGPPGTGKTRTAVSLVKSWRCVQASRAERNGEVHASTEGNTSAEDGRLYKRALWEVPSNSNTNSQLHEDAGAIDGGVGGMRGVSGRFMSDADDKLPPARPPPGGQVLAVASSNTAVDQLLEGLVGAGLKVLRIGDVVRVRPELRACGLQSAVAAHPDMARVRKLKAELEAIVKRLERLTAVAKQEALGKGTQAHKGYIYESQSPPLSGAGSQGLTSRGAGKVSKAGSAYPTAQAPSMQFSTLSAGQAGSLFSRSFVAGLVGGGGWCGGGTGGLQNVILKSIYAGLPVAAFSTAGSSSWGVKIAQEAARDPMLRLSSFALSTSAQRLMAERNALAPGVLSSLRKTLYAMAKKIEIMEFAVKQKTIAEADVIAATCMGAGHELLANARFALTVVDEASQIHEAELAIPLSKMDKESCLTLIGDERQLPPVIASDMALPLRVSLFERLAANAWPRRADDFQDSERDRALATSAEGLACIPVARTMLQQQYRMHPAIAAWPNWAFYNSRIASAPWLNAAMEHLHTCQPTSAITQAAAKGNAPLTLSHPESAHAPPPGFPWPRGFPLAFIPVIQAAYITAAVEAGTIDPNELVAKALREATVRLQEPRGPQWRGLAERDRDFDSGKGMGTGMGKGKVLIDKERSSVLSFASGNERDEGKSKSNRAEALVIARALRALLAWRPWRDGSKGARPDMQDGTPRGARVIPKDIGVVSPYLSQVKLLATYLKAEGLPVPGAVRPTATATIAARVLHVKSNAEAPEVSGALGEGFRTDPACAVEGDALRLMWEGVTADGVGGSGVQESEDEGEEGDYPCIEVRSVDGYQGREKGVLLLSAVRSNARGEVGFLADYRRLNVAMTRGKRGLIVVGDPFTLARDPAWSSFLSFVQTNRLAVSVQAIPVY